MSDGNELASDTYQQVESSTTLIQPIVDELALAEVDVVPSQPMSDGTELASDQNQQVESSTTLIQPIVDELALAEVDVVPSQPMSDGTELASYPNQQVESTIVDELTLTEVDVVPSPPMSGDSNPQPLFGRITDQVAALPKSEVLSVEVKDANVTEKALHCGYNSCNAESVGLSNSSYSGGSEGSVLSNLYILATIFLIASLLAPVIIVIFVDPLSRFINIDESRSRSKSSLQLLVATFNHLRHPYQLLLIPISAVVGFNTGTLMADYTAAYISCVLGVHMVGYIIVCFGASSAVCALGMSLLVKVLGLVTVFTLGFLINLGLILVMIFWVPQPDDMIWFFIIGGIWGLSDAIWQTQVTVLYAVVFPKQMDEAFTNSVLWMCFGYSASYASSSVLCLNSKVIIFIILLVLGILGYYAIETIEKMGGLKKTVDGNVIPLDRLITRAFCETT
nr:UNC93-like protein [Procambarus clarkii]